MNETEGVTGQVAQLLDETIESVRWCRQHLQEPGVSGELRELQIKLAALALALDYEMDGATEKAEYALGHADRRLAALFAPRSPYDCA